MVIIWMHILLYIYDAYYNGEAGKKHIKGNYGNTIGVIGMVVYS